MARPLAARPMSLPAATWSMPLLRRCEASTIALPFSPGQSGIPEVPSSGLPSPPSSPPLAAITAANELTLLPKKRSGASSRGGINNTRPNRRGGATLRIREECERFFCETMKAVFLGERNMVGNDSSLAGVYNNNNDNDNHCNGGIGNGVRSPNGQLGTPPDDYGHMPVLDRRLSDASATSSAWVATATSDGSVPDNYCEVAAWLEMWDYSGGSSFRGFLTEDLSGEKTLFMFFDRSVVDRDLKQALMGLIELADSAMGCSQVVICVDRRAPAADVAALMKGLQWAGFSMTTLDTWTGGHGIDLTSRTWLFMGMEL